MSVDERFTRQVPLVGLDGQERIRAARVLVIGAGGLGCPTLMALAAAGVGHLTIMDPDHVERSNLHRQTLYREEDMGQRKVDVARRRLAGMAPNVTIAAIAHRFDESRRGDVAGYDVVVEGTDRLQARYDANDACRRAGVPLVTGAVEQWQGQAALLTPSGACYRCLWPQPGASPSCEEEGMVASQTGVIGNWLAQVALHTILSGAPRNSNLWTWDGVTGTMAAMDVPRRKGCSCHDKALKPQAPSQTGQPMLPEMTPMDLRQALASETPPFLLDVREPDERREGCIPNDDAHMPMMQIPERWQELPKDRQIAVYCAAGARSAQVTAFLRQQGIDAVNLHGGMYGWLATS